MRPRTDPTDDAAPATLGFTVAEFLIINLVADLAEHCGYAADRSGVFGRLETACNHFLRLSQTVEMDGPPIGAAFAGPLAALRADLRRAAPLLSRLALTPHSPAEGA